jgi:hypothetical protein
MTSIWYILRRNSSDSFLKFENELDVVLAFHGIRVYLGPDVD